MVYSVSECVCVCGLFRRAVAVHAFMHACMSVCMYVCIYVPSYLCMYLRMYIWLHMSYSHMYMYRNMANSQHFRHFAARLCRHVLMLSKAPVAYSWYLSRRMARDTVTVGAALFLKLRLGRTQRRSGWHAPSTLNQA